MSEENSNTVVGEVVETTTAVETQEETKAPQSLDDVKVERSEIRKQLQSHEVRREEALNRAKLETIKKPENISLEDMGTLDLPDGGVKGINYKEVVGALPEDAKQLLGNLRADYTRKTQELAQQRKELEARMKALTESEFMAKTREIAAQDDIELDPYDTKSFESRIEQEVARRLQDMMEPVRQQQELQMKQLQLANFKQQHPDLEDIKHDVAQVLQGNHSLSLEDAYWMVKGRKGYEKMNTLEAEAKERREAMRNAGLKIGTPRDFNPNKPPAHLKKGHEIYSWLSRNRKK
jgi:hypothetical protein